jgi:hypothetical protein
MNIVISLSIVNLITPVADVIKLFTALIYDFS